MEGRREEPGESPLLFSYHRPSWSAPPYRTRETPRDQRGTVSAFAKPVHRAPLLSFKLLLLAAY